VSSAHLLRRCRTPNPLRVFGAAVTGVIGRVRAAPLPFEVEFRDHEPSVVWHPYDQHRMNIDIAESEKELEACHTVMRQLRPHLALRDFITQVLRQQEETGYRIAYVRESDRVMAVAGYLFRETLADGYFLNIDDLVTDEAIRSKGYGAALIRWLIAQAVSNKCTGVQLDSGVQRFDAHRFYDREAFEKTAHHFAHLL